MNLAVVVPTINCLKYLQRMLASLPHRGELVIVIDQASTDDTPQWLAAHPEFLTLTQDKNIGVAPAWNLGIVSALHTGATHIAVLNNDIILEPSALDRLVAWEQRGVRVPTVKPIALGRSTAVPVENQIPWGEFPEQHWVSRPGDFCGFLITRAVVEAIGFFDEHYEIAYGEDLDFEMRLLRAGLPHGMCHDARVYHFGSRSVLEGGVENGPEFRNNVKYFQRKWGMHHEIARRLIAQAGPPIFS
jgi:N-acetylglucosaminyl-diphospho-decaprenol L-rhamnosyltransferase